MSTKEQEMEALQKIKEILSGANQIAIWQHILNL